MIFLNWEVNKKHPNQTPVYLGFPETHGIFGGSFWQIEGPHLYPSFSHKAKGVNWDRENDGQFEKGLVMVCGLKWSMTVFGYKLSVHICKTSGYSKDYFTFNIKNMNVKGIFHPQAIPPLISYSTFLLPPYSPPPLSPILFFFVVFHPPRSFSLEISRDFPETQLRPRTSVIIPKRFGTCGPETVEVKSQIHWRLSSLAPLLTWIPRRMGKKAAALLWHPGCPVEVCAYLVKKHHGINTKVRYNKERIEGICAEGKLKTNRNWVKKHGNWYFKNNMMSNFLKDLANTNRCSKWQGYPTNSVHPTCFLYDFSWELS